VAGQEKKEFKPKFGMPELVRYDAGHPEGFWEKFPENKRTKGESMIDGVKLWELANTHGCGDWDRLFTVCKDLKQGANIGCKGENRLPTISKNAKSAFKFGAQVTDAIADWVNKGFAIGPIREEDVPPEAKINSILCREKPNGSVRVILNLSKPKGLSVNDGIDKEEFPAEMSSTEKWIAVLAQAGKGAWMMKIDWSDAYKHIHVREEDLHLQWFSWLDMYFYELCLIFGSASSPGIYDRAAKTVLDIVLRRTGFPRHMVCQHLDDLAAACAQESDTLEEFDKAYNATAKELGIKIAPRDDPEKAFAKSKHGIVFGIEYDTENWTWAIPKEKLAKISSQIRGLLEWKTARQDEIQSIVGRIIHVRPLILGGRFYVDKLMELNNIHEDGSKQVELTTDFKRQLYMWYIILHTCSGKASIPHPVGEPTPWAIHCFTDAAGGSLSGPGKGIGVAIPEWGWWTYMPWSRKVNDGSLRADGKKVSRKMAALELIGPLVAISAGAHLLAGKPVVFWVDNQGSCGIWKHGYSGTCNLSTTIVKAVALIAATLGCQVVVEKIARCSDKGSVMADALSQGDFRRFREQGPMKTEPATIPKEVLKWCVKPVVDENLGITILRALSQEQKILGINC